MEAKEDDDGPDEWPSSPYHVLQHLSEEAVRVAGEAIQSVYMGSPVLRDGHRRSSSETVAASNGRNQNFFRWKSQMQKALRWGNHSPEQTSPSFNPEVLANQKRQWYELQSKSSNQTRYKEPTSLFEHFIIVGLHPDANLEKVEDAFAKRKKWEMDMAKYDMLEVKPVQDRGTSFPTLEPQILFKYPPGEKLAVRSKDLAAFCFPAGVKARVLERTPSLSALNDIVYGQEHLYRDDLSSIFSLKVADNATLYGVCLHVHEIVQRPPAIVGAMSATPRSSGGLSRCLISAPRCYCVLTRVPFFELHYEMLNSIIAQDRLNRITEFISEMSLSDYVRSGTKLSNPVNENIDSPSGDSCTNWMASAIPVNSAITLTAAAAGIISDDELRSSSCRRDSLSPESGRTSDASDYSQMKELEKDGSRSMHCLDEYANETSENHPEGLKRAYGSFDNGHTSPKVGTYTWRRSWTVEHLGTESLLSRVKIMESEDEDEDNFWSHEKEVGDEIIMEWARENKNDLLQIVCCYHALPLPVRGNEVVFLPLEHLQPIKYRRPPVSALGLNERYLNQNLLQSQEVAKVNLKLDAAEEALALSTWTTATICRVLSLENVLSFITGVLLEKQVVVVCPNVGVLSAVVLSSIPIIRPFEWQSLLLPILPGQMLDFIDAPVPFIIGLQHKPSDWKMKTSNLVHINVTKNQVKAYNLPALPHQKELISKLRPFHTRLSHESCVAERHPVYKCNEVQVEAAAQFLLIMRQHLESFCSDLCSHTITSVQSNNDRVSLLLKDSYIDSFSSRDQPFIKLFVDTQLFSVFSDTLLSSVENEY